MSDAAVQTSFGQSRRSARRQRLRLARKMLGAVVASLLIAEIAWLIPSYGIQYAGIHDETETLARKLVKAAVDPRTFATLSDEEAIIKRLEETAHIVGARIEDTAGEPLAVVGIAPAITVLEAKRDKIRTRESADNRYLDIYLPEEETLLAHPMVARIDLGPAYTQLLRHLLDIAAAIVVIATLTCLGMFAFLYPILFRPIGKIHKAVLRGVSELDIADNFVLQWDRNDEIGDLARAINLLLIGASENYNEQLYTAHEVIEKSPIATLVYLPSGGLSYANQAALDLFGTKDLDALGALDQAFLDLQRDTKAPLITIEEALSAGKFSREGFVVTSTGRHDMVCIGDITYREDGSVRRYVCQFLDLTVAMDRIARLETTAERATNRRLSADARSVKLKVLLESCMIVLNPGEVGSAVGTAVIELEGVIRTWAQIYAAVGKARRVLYNRLPALSGNRRLITTLFRQALSYVEFRSQYRDSELRVIATEANGRIEFEISENPTEESIRKTRAEAATRDEAMLCLAALSRLVVQCNGVTDFPDNTNGPVAITFMLPKVISGLSAPANKSSELAA